MSSVVIRATRPDSGFFMVRNEVARDVQLSFRDRGVLFYLLSHADGFRFNVAAMAANNPEGRQALYATMKNLEKAGYLVRRRIHDKATGKFTWETTVYDVPQTRELQVAKTAPEAKGDQVSLQASRLVADVWEPAVRGTTAQTAVSVVKIIDTALRNGVTAPKCAKALATLAGSKTTVSAYTFNKALNGEPIKGQLKADQKTDWSNITALSDDTGATPF